MANKTEQRNFSGVELRAAANDFALVGVAAAYNTWSGDLGGYREQIAPGAFTRSLREKRDVKCLYNHDSSQVYGRVKNGTLTLTDTAQGLAFRCQLDRNNRKHADMYASIERGDIDECSFAFTVGKDGQVWSERKDKSGKVVVTRTLTDVDLIDVSAVCYPAYPEGTEVGARQQRSTHYVVQVDWRTAVRAKLQQLDAQYDAVNRRIAARIGQEIAEGK